MTGDREDCAMKRTGTPATVPAKPRGRPRVFSSEQEALFRNLFPEIRTRRGLQNRMYACRAISVLKQAAGADVFGRFGWLLGPSFEAAKMRFTLLAELGRLDRPADIATLASTLCEKKDPPRRAVALIRQRVRKTGKARPTVEDATYYLASAVDTWLQRYPDADLGVMVEALNEVYSIIQERLEKRRPA
jgi:hypothetical protein